MARTQKRRLEEIVGKETYIVWTNMLRELVPNGRTHRLAPMVAGMLQYALEKCDDNPDEGSVAYALLVASESSDPDEALDLLQHVIERLLRDAKVKYRRTSSRGERYSIVESVVYEFVHWYDMPWEA